MTRTREWMTDDGDSRDDADAKRRRGGDARDAGEG